MANIFKSKYTGEQIEEILDKANNVTDVQANNGEPTTADLSTLKIGDVNYKIPKGVTVEANPTGEATENITKIEINGVIYNIQNGSSNVEANPAEDGTTELTKLKIGDVVYTVGGQSSTLYVHQIITSGTRVSVSFVSKSNVSLVGKTIEEIFGYGKNLILVQSIGSSSLISLGMAAKFDEMGIPTGYNVFEMSSNGAVSTKTMSFSDVIAEDNINEYDA